MKYLLITLLALLLVFPAFAALDLSREITAHNGTVELLDGQTWLNAAYGDQLRLLLAPASLLRSLGLVFEPGDSLFVEGIREQNLLLVDKLWTAASGPWQLRNLADGQVETGGQARYGVSSDICIGCRLCVASCPTGAITMTKGKAKIDLAKCTECVICVDGNGRFRGCPVGAIQKR